MLPGFDLGQRNEQRARDRQRGVGDGGLTSQLLRSRCRSLR